MSELTVKRFGEADEVRPFADHGSVALLNFGSKSVGLATFEPGWKWSSDVRPIAGTDSCEVSHACFVLSGRMHIKMDNGDEEEVSSGDVAFISPGHDAWVVGDEACRMIDFGSIEHYAEQQESSEERAATGPEPSPMSP